MELKEALDTALSALTSDDQLISSLNLQLLKAYKAEEEFWKQRSRLLWLTLGDKNTSYFHASTKGRRARNIISVIETSNGEPVYEDNMIADTIGEYFREIFTSTGHSALEIVNKALKPCISAATNDKLIQNPSVEEIKEAMFVIHPDKAPGPDGSPQASFNPTGMWWALQ